MGYGKGMNEAGKPSRIFGNLYNLACCIENTKFLLVLFRVDPGFYHFLGKIQYVDAGFFLRYVVFSKYSAHLPFVSH